MYYPLAIATGLATLAFLQGCQGCRVSKVEPGEEEGNVETAPPPNETGDSTIPPETGETGETGDTGGDEFLFTEEPRALIHFNNGGIGSIISVNVEDLLDAAQRIFDGETDARPEVVESTETFPVGRLLSSGGRVFLLGADTLTQIDPATGNSTGDDYNSWFTSFVLSGSWGVPLDVQYSLITSYTYVPFEVGTLIINPDGSKNSLESISRGNFGNDSSTWMNGPGGVANNGTYYQTVNSGNNISFVAFNGVSVDHDNDSIAYTGSLYSAHLLFNPDTNLFYGTNKEGFISLDPANATAGEVQAAVVLGDDQVAPNGNDGYFREGVTFEMRDPHWIGGDENFSTMLELQLEEDGKITAQEEMLSTIMSSTGYTRILSDQEEWDAYGELFDTVTALTRSGDLVIVGAEEDELHVWSYLTDAGYAVRVTMPADDSSNNLFSEYGTPVSVTSGTLSEDGTWGDFPWELGGEFYEEG